MPETTDAPAPPDTPAPTTTEPAEPADPESFERAADPPRSDDRLPWRVLLFRVVAIVVALAVGSGVFAALKATAPKLDTAAAEAVRTRVVAYVPQRIDVRRAWRGYGTARALDSADVPARVTATVASVPERILEGAAVRRGELLAQLDEVDFRAEVDRLDAALAEAQATLDQLDVQQRRLEDRLALEEEDVQIAREELDRVRNLNERNVTNPQDVDRARSADLAARRALTVTRETLDTIPPRRTAIEAQVRGWQAQRRVADQNYLRTKITAPIPGVLEIVDVEPGESVSPGTRVARIVDPSVIEVPVRLPASARPRLAVDDAVTLRPTNHPSRTFDARVGRINPGDDPQTRTVTVYALLNQENLPDAERLAPGTFVEADVLTGQPTPRLVVPRRALRKQHVQALIEDDQGDTLVVNRPVTIDYALRTELPETGLDDDQWAVLKDGALEPGTPIMATASSSLLPGQAVNITRTLGPDQRSTSETDPQNDAAGSTP